jgi:hypothetical protein
MCGKKAAAREGIEIEEPEQEVEEPTGTDGGPDKETEEAPPPPLADEPWPTLHDDALYGIAGNVVREIEPHSESDRASILVQTLVGVGNAIGRHPHYIIGRTYHHTNLNSLMAGRTAKARKGTSWDWVYALLEKADHYWIRCIVTSLSSGEGLIFCVRDPVYTMKKGNREMIDTGVDDKRLLVASGEFNQILQS